jgi:hypothetical protein
MEGAAPDLIRPVIGFRQFRVVGSELWSLHGQHRWLPGVQTAHCLAEVAHDTPPVKGCTCGFYARYTPAPRTGSLATADLVGGAVALWGRIELHAHGMRAQHAMVVALALPASRGAKHRNTVAAADSLAISAVPARRLTATALAFGDVIPRAMRPPDVMPNKRAAPGEPAPARLYAVADGLKQRNRSSGLAP